MAVTVRLPGTLSAAVGGTSKIQATGPTVAAVFGDVDRRHPGFRSLVLDASGALRSYLNVYVGDTDVRSTGGLETVVPDGSEVMVIPAMSGGR